MIKFVSVRRAHGEESAGAGAGRRLSRATVATTLLLSGLAGGAVALAPGALADGTTPPPVQERNAATVTSDALPTVQLDDGVVWTQVVNGNTDYVGGSFTNARPYGAAKGTNLSARSDLLSYDVTTGNLLPFAPTLNGQVKALALSPDKSRLYVGGSSRRSTAPRTTSSWPSTPPPAT